MKQDKTRRVHPLLQPYIPLVDFIVQVFGDYCEVILHDLSDMEHSIVAIAGNITGRTVGGHITDFGLEIVHNPKYQQENYVLNYSGTTKDQKRKLRSSTYFIRDEEGTPVGLLCINVDITDFLQAQELVERMVTVDRGAYEPENIPIYEMGTELPISTMEDSLQREIDLTCHEGDVSKLTADEKRQIISHLQMQGYFSLKGAVGLVARHLAVSEQTVYRYLRESNHSEKV